MKIPRYPPELLRIPPRFERYVDEDLLTPLRPRIRYHQRRLLLGDRQTRWLVSPAAYLGGAMVLAAVIGPGLILYLARRSLTEAFVATGVGYGLTMLGFLPLYRRVRAQLSRLSSRTASRLFVHLLVRAAIIVSLSLSLSATLYSATALHPLLRFAGSAAVLMPGLVVLAMFIYSWAVGKASRVQSRRRNRDYADSALVAAYLRILNALPADHGPRREFENRRRLIAEMDLVVDLLGRGLPQFVRPPGLPMDEEAQRTFRRMATAQRMQKRLVYFPAGGSMDELARSAVNGLVASAFRWWAMLPQEEEVPVQRRKRLWQWLARVLSTVAVAALPLVALALSRRLGLLKGEIPPSVSAIAYGWVVVTLLNALDPAAGGKLGVMKDAAGLLKLPGGR